MAFTNEDYGTKIERKYCAHYINVNLTTPFWERIGKDLEELNFELNADVEDKKNILGEVETIVSAYAPTASVTPYYAREGTKLFEWLQDCLDKRKVLDDLKVEYLEVHVWDKIESTETYKAFKETAVIVPTSRGGDTTGYQIPFEIHLQNDVTEGAFDPATKTFTA